MGDLDTFISEFSGLNEEHRFYNGEVKLIINHKDHQYFLVDGDELKLKDSVTQILGRTIDKSQQLVPWGCKMMAEKLIRILPRKPVGANEREVVPSMYLDTVTDLINKAKSAHREKLEDAGNVGHIAHKWIERYIISCLAEICIIEPPPIDERAANGCSAAIDWMVAHNVRWLATETLVYSRIHEVPGTTDGRALVDSCSDRTCCSREFKDKLSIIDWKTSNHLYLAYLFQAAFYAHAYMEEFPEEVIEDVWVIRLDKEDAGFYPWHIDTKEELEVYYYGFLNCLRTFRSIKNAEEAIKEKLDRQKAARKEKREAEKADRLKLKCANADKYKGIRFPTCNKGNPCKSCMDKYAENHSGGA